MTQLWGVVLAELQDPPLRAWGCRVGGLGSSGDVESRAGHPQIWLCEDLVCIPPPVITSSCQGLRPLLFSSLLFTPTAQWGLEVVGLEARAERMLQSQAPIRKLTGRKRVRKESGLWKPEATRVPCQPPSPSHSRVPRDQSAGGCWICSH